MQIKELGEFGLIDRLTKEFPIVNKSTELSVGDDCAILDYTGKKTLVTKDLLLEGVHFDLTYCPLLHLGYKSAIVNFSDVYAMNGKPKQMVVGLGVSSKLCVEDLDELYAGMKIACEDHGVDLIGGDTTASLNGLTISITCIGEGEEGKIVNAVERKTQTLSALLEILVPHIWVCFFLKERKRCSTPERVQIQTSQAKNIWWNDS